MSLTTDLIFFTALKANTELMTTINNRLYSTAIPLPDEAADNVPAPYVILTFDGLTNDDFTKDSFEGETDTVTIGVTIVAEDRPSLGQLANTVRTTIREYFEDNQDDDDDIPQDYRFTATAINYDSLKPAFYQTLNYQCDSNV